MWIICHLGYWNGTIFAILNLYIAPMTPIKFRLNLTYGLGGDVIWRIIRWPLWRPSGILEWNDFSNSESLCHCNASHQVSAQSHIVWKEMSFEEFQDGCHGSHLVYRNGMVLAILNLYVAPMPHIKFRLNLTNGLGGDVVWRILRWHPCRPSWISEWKDFSNSESLCHWDASHQVSVQSNLRFGRRCRLKNFKMVAILDIQTEQF